jgi:hypothetical protein
MKPALLKSLLIIVLISLSLVACKELQPVVDKVKPYMDKASASTNSDSLSVENMIEAIKQALSQGARDSINLLGSARGFSLSDVYHIPLPDALEKPADLLRKFGQGDRVDEFENRLNQAAEQSVKRAMPVFTTAIKQMSVEDAVNILKGPDNAATLYFRNKTEAELRDQFMPIIRTATSQTGLTRSYKSLKASISTMAPMYSSRLVDIDEYVSDHAMDALFDRIAIEEKLIRENPAKRGTDLMRRVYGYFAK